MGHSKSNPLLLPVAAHPINMAMTKNAVWTNINTKRVWT